MTTPHTTSSWSSPSSRGVVEVDVMGLAPDPYLVRVEAGGTAVTVSVTVTR